MANGFFSGLLGDEDELKTPQQQALGSSLLMAGLQGLMASGPSLSPTSLGQILGQAGMTGVSTYEQSLQQAQASQMARELQQSLGGGGGDPSDVAGRYREYAARLAATDPQKAKMYMDLAEKVEGRSEKFTGNLANAALELFGTADISKLSEDQRRQAAEFYRQQELSRAQAGRSQIQNIIGGPSLSPFEEARDKAFASEAQQWMSGGGQDVMGQIAQLKPVIEALERGENISGVNVAMQPDMLLALTNPKALQSREQVEEVVQRNLRAVLGAQFTEREGERLISRAFNPKLRPEENAKRLRRLFLQMESAAQQKQEMVQYANQFGTLRGYQGQMPTIADFYRAIEGSADQTPPGAKPLDEIFRK